MEIKINQCLELSTDRINKLIERFNELQADGSIPALKKSYDIQAKIAEQEEFQKSITGVVDCEKIFSIYDEMIDAIRELEKEKRSQAEAVQEEMEVD